jgi:phosphotransferase system enzyme I (PtsP)
MFPMVAEVSEFVAGRRILQLEVERERERGGQLPRLLRVGAMLEVPALMWQLDALLTEADFLSVGSNDLFQFLYASDRGNPRVAQRYDVLAPGLLSLLRDLAARCAAADVPLSLCGEMAGKPLEAMALIGLGFRNISMPPATVGPVKAMIRSLNVGMLGTYLSTLYDLPDHSLRQKLAAFASDHGIAIDGP